MNKNKTTASYKFYYVKTCDFFLNTETYDIFLPFV